MTTQDFFLVMSGWFDQQYLGVCSLGRTAEVCYTFLPQNQILFLDCLGSVTDTAIGVAIGCPETWVCAFDTDGSFLSNAGTVYSIATAKAKGLLSHFSLFILDNKLLESGGGHTSRDIDLKWNHLFAAWGVTCQIISECDELKRFLELRKVTSNPQVAIIDINNTVTPCESTKDIDGRESKYMFKRYIHENLKKGIIRPCVKN